MANISGAFSGAASGASAGASIGGPYGAAIGGVVGGIAGLFSKKPDAKASFQPLDISKVITEARASAAANYQNSIALEKQYNPGAAALRDTSNANLSSMADRNPQLQSFTSQLLHPGVNTSVSSNPLLDESAARIMHNLRLGGSLGADVQAQAMRATLEKSSAAGIAGSGAQRGLAARDLGLTSMGLEQQRIAAAQEAGAKQAQLNLSAEQLRLQDLLGRGNLLQGAANSDIQRQSILSSLIDARALPESGLNSGSIASMMVGNQNALNQTNTLNAAIGQQQSNQNLNSILGFGSTLASSGALGGIGKGLAALFKGSGGAGDDAV